MEYLRKIYRRLQVTLTDEYMAPESFYNSMLADVCAELEASGVAVISDGALCAFPPGFTGRDGRPLPLMLRKSDGGYGYDSTDLAAIRYRLRDLGVTRIIYVVGSEQHQHLQMVFAVARQAGWLTDAASAEHAVIGLVTAPGGQRLRTRSGEQAKLITLIDEAVARADKVIEDRYDRSRRAQPDRRGGRDRRAEVRRPVGGPRLELRPRLRPDAGPDRQHRAVPAVRDGADPVDLPAGRARAGGATGPIQLTEPTERALALRLLGFGAAVTEVASAAEPHRLAAFLFETASAFTAFYEQCPVLKAEDESTRHSRLALSALTLRVLLTGLGLLGIPVPDRM